MSGASSEITIRTADENDIAALAHIHAQGWKASYEGIVDQDFLDGITEDARAADWKRWFAEGKMDVLIAQDKDGKACGFCSFGRLRTPIPGHSPIRPLYTAEIYAIYVLPEYWRQGAGTALLCAVVRALQDKKHKSLCLWVLEKNARACAFYKKMGGERCGKKDIEIGVTKVKEVCYGWRKMDSLVS